MADSRTTWHGFSTRAGNAACPATGLYVETATLDAEASSRTRPKRMHPDRSVAFPRTARTGSLCIPEHGLETRATVAARATKSLILAVAIALAGCTVHPAGESAERRSASEAGRAFAHRFEDRSLPALSNHPTPDELVRYAMMANADLEQKFWDWRSAIEQIPQEGTPQTTLAINAATNVTRGRTALADTVLTAQNMPSMMIPWPGKLTAAARQALESARAAGLRFRQAQFDLRGKVLAAYDDYALTAELIRLEQANAELLDTTVMVVEIRNRAGSASQADLLKARNELDLSRNDIRTLRAQLPAQRAALNALLGRAPDAPLDPPASLPADRPLAISDSQLLALAVRQNPSLAALERDIRSKENGVELARLQYFPDVAVGVSSDLAAITQSLMGMVSVPLLRHEALDAAISQAQANLRSSQAMLRQSRNDLNARVVMDIVAVRDAARQLHLFQHAILPRAQQVVALTRSAYETGRSTLLDVLDSQRSLISLRRLTATLRAAEDKQLADLESITAMPLDEPATTTKSAAH